MATYYKQEYICQKCGTVQKHYVWSNEIDTTKHACVDINCLCSDLQPVDEETVQAPALLGFRVESNLKQRRQRNKKHFKQHVLPTVSDPDVKAHHFKKLGIKS